MFVNLVFSGNFKMNGSLKMIKDIVDQINDANLDGQTGALSFLASLYPLIESYGSQCSLFGQGQLMRIPFVRRNHCRSSSALPPFRDGHAQGASPSIRPELLQRIFRSIHGRDLA